MFRVSLNLWLFILVKGLGRVDSRCHVSRRGPRSGKGFPTPGACWGPSAICLEPLLGRGEQHFARILFHPANGISLFPVERENVQKRTFTRWVNLHLEKVSGALGLSFGDRFIRERAVQERGGRGGVARWFGLFAFFTCSFKHLLSTFHCQVSSSVLGTRTLRQGSALVGRSVHLRKEKVCL